MRDVRWYVTRLEAADCVRVMISLTGWMLGYGWRVMSHSVRFAVGFATPTPGQQAARPGRHSDLTTGAHLSHSKHSRAYPGMLHMNKPLP